MDNPPLPRNFSDLQKPLDSFRAKTKRLKVHPGESAVVALVALHLVFLPWALGSMWPWAQFISLGLATLGFAASLIPRNYDEEHTGGNRFRLIMWPKLLKFPVFWLGLLLLGYVALQGLNPAWSYRTDGKLFWMQSIPSKAWWPLGYEAPFAKWNPWRMLVIYASAWLTMCTLWVGFTRRRSVQVLLLILAGNGLALAALGVAQRLLGNGKIFWFFESPNAQFFSSFVYKNHGAAYLNLILAVTTGLAGWFYLRGLRRMEKSNPSGVLAFFATCIAVSILTSYARGVTLMMLGFLAVCVAAFVWHQIRLPSESRKSVVALALVLLFGYFLMSGLDALKTGEAWDRFKTGITRQDYSLASREQVTVSALEMLRERGLRGTGAGSFRFLFPLYQHRNAELRAIGTGHLFWEHAHNDIVQIPIELGAIGTGLILLGAGYFMLVLIRGYFWENPVASCLVFGIGLLLLYAWWDFPFQCPAVLITTCALCPIAVLWTNFEEQGAKS